MKFSVLLPTRNRLEYLKYAVESVRRQDYEDWELIISDNYSDEDIAGYVKSLSEPRIKCYRTNSFIPVTDNWNNALERSNGDYIIMLGDDDCIMKGYFKKAAKLIKEYDEPEVIYTNAFHYAYPGVMPTKPEGYLAQPLDGYPVFLKSGKKPYILPKREALKLVWQSLKFKCRLVYNMQNSLISRNLINSLEKKGRFFQSPYPDYYATNVIFLKAEKILIYPYPLATIGISPKSFGFFYFNNSENQGLKFLKNHPNPEVIGRLEKIMLPHPEHNNCWLLAMEQIQLNYAAEFSNLKVNYQSYRSLQIYDAFKKYQLEKNLTQSDLSELWNAIKGREKLLYISLLWAWNLANISPPFVKRKIVYLMDRLVGTYPPSEANFSDRHYKNILEVFEEVAD